MAGFPENHFPPTVDPPGCAVSPLGGHLPYGYSISSFTERMTASGPEATVVYFGDPLKRFEFLELLFGKWVYTAGDDWNCCPQLISKPCPYPFARYNVGNEPATGDSVRVRCGPNGLYPDRYTIRPAGRNADIGVTQPFGATTPVTTAATYWDDPYNPTLGCPPWFDPTPNLPGDETLFEQVTCNWPFFYTCPIEIEVNYVWKHTDWPDWLLEPCRTDKLEGTNVVGSLITSKAGLRDSNNFPLPPDGTFLSVRKRSDLSHVTIKGRDFVFCHNGEPVPPDTPLAYQFIQETYEVDWMGVPNPPFSEIRDLQGKINACNFMGYPPESIMFLAESEPEARYSFDGRPLFDLKYKFIARTVVADCDQFGDPATTILNGRMGIWNRLIWDKQPEVPADLTGPIVPAAGAEVPVCCNPWYRVGVRGNCGSPPGEVHQCKSEYEMGSFALLFQWSCAGNQMNTVECPLGDCIPLGGGPAFDAYEIDCDSVLGTWSPKP